MASHLFHAVTHSFFHALVITVFIVMIMMMIESLNVFSRGKFVQNISRGKLFQILLAAVMGIIPGCLGTFAFVSLYIHGAARFSALVTVMLASFGDEAFFLLAQSPKNALYLGATLFLLAIVFGILIEYVFKISWKPKIRHGFEIHHHEIETNAIKTKAISEKLPRLFILLSILFFSSLIFFGIIAKEEETWFRITMIVVSALSMIIISFSSAHFVKVHLWEHVIKKHFLVILIWVFLAFVVLHFAEHQLNVKEWISDNTIYLILIAALVGLIPTSGPHMVFISFFLSGFIPFYILLVNSIVQEGHGSLPLLALHKKDFLLMKALKFVFALLIGFIFYFLR